MSQHFPLDAGAPKTNDFVRNEMRSSVPQAHDVKGDPVDNPSLAFIEAVRYIEK